MSSFLSGCLKLTAVLIVAAVLVGAGFAAGYLVRGPAAPDPGAEQPTERARHEALRRTAEAYEPSCDDLAAPGLTRVSENGSTYLFVFTAEDRFEVIGIDFKPGKPTVTYSWSAGLAHARETCGQ